MWIPVCASREISERKSTLGPADRPLSRAARTHNGGTAGSVQRLGLAPLAEAAWRTLSRSAALFSLAALCFPVALFANANGARGKYSGGDFPGESSCTQCHTGAAANSGSGIVTLLFDGVSAEEFVYAPGQVVSLIVRASDENAARIGFQLTARSGNGCVAGGNLAAGSPASGGPVNIVDEPCLDSQVQWATHRLAKAGTEAEFAVEWTAPATDVGPVTFAVAVNAANGDGRASGDSIYTLQTPVPFGGEALGPPVISEAGVVMGDGYSQSQHLVPGALAMVTGTDFVAAGTEAWLALGPQKHALTLLESVCLEVNRVSAPLKYVSPQRIDFQVPAMVNAGSGTVQVIRNCDDPNAVRSNEATVDISAVQPVFFLLSQAPPIVAGHRSDETLVGPANLLPGVSTSPAAPGDVVSLFGTGFGPVVPPLETGETAREERPLAATNVSVHLGETEIPAADVLYVGAAPGFLGTHRVDVRVPTTTPDGEHAVVLSINGVASPDGPRLSVIDPPLAPQGLLCVSGKMFTLGQSCTASFGGAMGYFQVEMSGKACFNVPARGLERCGDQEVELPFYGASAERGMDGSWTITVRPESP